MNTDNRLGRIKYDFKSGEETYSRNPNFGKPLPPKPILVEKFTDNGDHSHWSLVNSENGEMLWSEAPEEELPCNRPQQFADLQAEIERLKGEKWVSVKDEVPNEFQSVAFVVVSHNESYNNRILGGTYLGFKGGIHEFAIPGIGFEAELWQPLPSPPNIFKSTK